MQEIRFVHVVKAWGHDQAAVDYIAGVAEVTARARGESDLIYGELLGTVPEVFQNQWHVEELCDTDHGSRQFRCLNDTVEVLKPQVIWLHDNGCHTLLQRLNRPQRSYALWQHVHNHGLSCLTSCHLRNNQDPPLCREPLSIRCFSEIDAGQCYRSKTFGDGNYLFTDYISRLNLILAMQKLD
jgi:hypothetical protein